MLLYKELLNYNFESNEKVFDCYVSLNRNDEYILKLSSHIINAQEIWLSRIKNNYPDFGVWDIHELKEIQLLNQKLHTEWIVFFKTLEPEQWKKTITYTNSKNVKYQSLISEIFYHVINHSTYHRGQIMAKIRALGGEPVNTDFIYSIRKPADNI